MIERLIVENFRCFDKYSLSLNRNITQLVGNNGIGKTSLIEALYFCVTGKSFRESNLDNLLKKEEKYLKVSIQMEGSTHSIVYSNSRRKCFVDDIEQKKIIYYVGFINLIVFHQDDMRIISDGPNERRSFLDRELCLNNKDYLIRLTRYKKLLKQRNDILKYGNINYDYFEIINQELYEDCLKLLNYRLDFIDSINYHLQEKFKIFSSSSLALIYDSSSSPEDLYNYFTKDYETDISARQTTKGIHRDDFILLYNGEKCSYFASMGIQYMIIIALKLAIAEFLSSTNNKNTVVLIDDIVHNLDQNNTIKVFNEINKYQVITTSTSVINLIEDTQVIELTRES
jgi:DNA replication and repair protein RecF